ncbi:anthranilate synthase [Trifolium repens]|nr:anthranilate synthase [Trifolium repens]
MQVSKPGFVKVEKLMNIERYSHVMHISSTVTAELLDGLTSWDALRLHYLLVQLAGHLSYFDALKFYFCVDGFIWSRLLVLMLGYQNGISDSAVFVAAILQIVDFYG